LIPVNAAHCRILAQLFEAKPFEQAVKSIIQALINRVGLKR